MEFLRKAIVFILFILFIGLLALLIKVYLDVRVAKGYIEFVTDSSNSLIVRVDQINLKLNSLQYDEDQDLLEELKGELEESKILLDQIKTNRKNYKIPYKGEGVDEKFDEYLWEGEALIAAFDAVVTSIDNLEEESVFGGKIDEYVSHSDALQTKSSELEVALTEYVQDYAKFDFKRVIDGIKFI